MTQDRVLIIADDLTGSLDTGVHFAESGLRTAVVGVERSAAVAPGCRAVVVNTESRHTSAQDAALRISAAVDAFARGPATVIYKKTDSTLRGNIAAEFAALLAHRHGRSIVFAPALPAQGRTTSAGVHYVHGTPLAKTDFARDPVNPITTSVIAELLTGANIPEVVQCTPTDLETTLLSSLEGSVLVVDAASEEDLAQIAAVCRAHPKRVIPAGSAGLAHHLLADMAAGDTSSPAILSLPRPRILVSGSLNPVALAQSAEAIALGLADVELSPDVAAALIDAATRAKANPPTTAAGARAAAVITNAAEALAAGHDLCLRTVLDREHAQQWSERFRASSTIDRPMHVSLPAAYGQLVRKIMDGTRIGTLVVFGGDTLNGILDALAVPAIEPIAQIMPGVVRSEIDAEGYRLTLITKAGGFGADLPLVRTIFTDTDRSGPFDVTG